jgi:CubicO group peptidase (beta-lactamase class C family)
VTRTVKRWWTILLGIMLAATAGGGYQLWQLAPMGAAYKAKILCSSVFVSQREPASVLNADLSADVHPLLRWVEARVDGADRTTRASLFGLRERVAVYRERHGCALVHDEMRPWVGVSLTAVPESRNNNSMEWPEGEEVEAQAPSAGLAAALDWAFAEPDPQHLRRTRAVMVVHRGRIVAERYADGIAPDTPLIGWSMTKSVMNALVGVAVGQGRLALDRPVALRDWQTTGDARAAITLEQLLHMSSGLEFNEDYDDPLEDVIRMLLATDDMAAYAAAKPLLAAPGTRFAYSSGTSNIVARVLRDALGEADYPDFPRRALFEPLGMRSAVIETDAAGTFVGSSFMYASARDWARFGLLYLRDGVWSGRRVLPDGWVRYTRTPAPADPQRSYGAHFWLKVPREYRRGSEAARDLPADAFHAIGHEGQFVTVVPSRDLVFVRLGLTRDRDGTWDHEAFTRRVLAALGGD